MTDLHPPIIRILELERSRDLLWGPPRPQPRLHHSPQPRQPIHLARLRPPRPLPRPRLSPQRPIPLPTPIPSQLTPHRRRRTLNPPRDPPNRLTRLTPHLDLHPLHIRQPKPRTPPTPTHQRILIPNPPHRPIRNPKPRRDLPHRNPLPQPNRHPTTHHHTHRRPRPTPSPPNHPSHQTLQSTQKHHRVAMTG